MSLDDVLEWVDEGSSEALLARQVDLSRLPVHIAVIMDGNGGGPRNEISHVLKVIGLASILFAAP